MFGFWERVEVLERWFNVLAVFGVTYIVCAIWLPSAVTAYIASHLVTSAFVAARYWYRRLHAEPVDEIEFLPNISIVAALVAWRIVSYGTAEMSTIMFTMIVMGSILTLPKTDDAVDRVCMFLAILVMLRSTEHLPVWTTGGMILGSAILWLARHWAPTLLSGKNRPSAEAEELGYGGATSSPPPVAVAPPAA